MSGTAIKNCICPNNSDSISNIGRPRIVWAIPAIHGQLEPLQKLHDYILEQIRPGDRVVYHGNYTGYSADSAACISEILTFRRMVLSLEGMMPSDIQYLRGRQELIWQKLFQLHYAPNPTDVLLWMLGNGLSETLYSYNLCPHEGIEACKYGTLGITKWTGLIRKAIRAHAGHDVFMCQLKRAAFTDTNNSAPMLFVHAGLNPQQSLHDQGEHFWWACESFQNMDLAYKPFEKVIRGYDPEHKGSHLNCVTATIDDGCGFGGNLVGVAFDENADVSMVLEATH